MSESMCMMCEVNKIYNLESGLCRSCYQPAQNLNLLTEREHMALDKYLPAIQTVTKVKRRSEREYDFNISGTEVYLLEGKPLLNKEPINFSFWMPLALIRESVWTLLAPYSSIPEMVREGDWSGIRDSEKDAIWAMLDQVLTDKKYGLI